VHRSMSLRRKSDSDTLSRAASQLLLVDEEIDYRAISDGEESSSNLQSRKSYFSKSESTAAASTSFRYPARLDGSKPAETSQVPRQSLGSQQALQPSTFASIRSMLQNFNLADEA
jgi:hypothetical protein